MTNAPEPEADRSAATYTGWLRGLSDTELAGLFAARPDLMHPVPADMPALAARATARAAVARVLDRSDRFALQVLEGVVALGDERAGGPPGVERSRLAAALATEEEHSAAALFRIREHALVWTDGERLRPVSVLRDLLPQPAGLGPPLRVLLADLPFDLLRHLGRSLGAAEPATSAEAAARAADAVLARLPHLLATAGTEARAVLDRLAWGPPHGTVTHAYRLPEPETATSPVELLLARGLLVATGESAVTLPREVALELRGGRLHRRIEAAPPALEGARRPAEELDRAAAGQAFTVIRAAEDLLDAWAEDPPGVLRNGGLGLRDLRGAARLLETDEPTAILVVEAAHAAGLLASGGTVDGEWLPTVDFDAWRKEAPARRWLRLAQAWLRSTRVPSLAEEKGSRGRGRTVLGEGLDRGAAPEVRLELLGVLATAPEGLMPTAESVHARHSWLRPRKQGPATSALIDATLHEAALLGLTAGGAPATCTRLLWRTACESSAETEGGEAEAAAALAEHLPEPVDHILVQGDLTAVAPGPLVPDLARELRVVADLESTGGAAVYRFTGGSVRRALDSGYGAQDLLGLLERSSATPLPQALRYLVEDTARRHGRLRVGTASSYLRCDDPVVLDEVTGDRRAEGLGLFRLAPTVAASPLTRTALLERLNDLGYHPVAEAADGSMRLQRPEVRRAEPRPATGPPQDPARPAAHLRTAAVRALRAGDRAVTTGRRPIPAPDAAPPRSPTAATLAALNAAVRDGDRLWIGYLDSDGLASSRIIEPARVEGGYLTAYDATQAAVRRFAVHRITGVGSVAAEDDGESGGDGASGSGAASAATDS